MTATAIAPTGAIHVIPIVGARQFDPTQTLGIRAQYERDMARRFRALRALSFGRLCT